MKKKEFVKKFNGKRIKLVKNLLVKLSIITVDGATSSRTTTTTHISAKMGVVFNDNGTSKGDQINLGVAGIGVGGKTNIVISCTWQELLAAM